jgi:3-oxoacyl-[acyl-carrier-protein] synthase-3
VAAGFIASGMYKTVLVVGAETLSRFLDPDDRATVILLGDGAGAAVLTRPVNPEQGVLYSKLGCDGSKTKLIWVPGGGSLVPASATTVAERLHYMHMKGREVYKFAVTKMQEMIDEALNDTGLRPDDLKLVIPHQSNLRIIESVREKLGLPREKVVVNIDRYGNTSAASVPIALDEARRSGQLKPGDHILMLALGAGLVWGTMIVRL